MKEQTGIDVSRPLRNDLIIIFQKVDRSFKGVNRQNISLFCTNSSHVRLLVSY